jgi:hypothetical protein
MDGPYIVGLSYEITTLRSAIENQNQGRVKMLTPVEAICVAIATVALCLTALLTKKRG